LPVELAVGPAAQTVEAAGGEFGVGLVVLVGNIQGLDVGQQELALFFFFGSGVLRRLRAGFTCVNMYLMYSAPFPISLEPQFPNFLQQQACTRLFMAFPQHLFPKGLILKDL